MQSPFADRLAFLYCRCKENLSYFVLPGTIRNLAVALSFPGSRSRLSPGINSFIAKTARLPDARFSFVLSNSSSATALRRLP
jgi:hypothetical protein